MQTSLTFNQKLESLLKEKLGLESEDLNLKANLESDLNIGEVEKADLVSFLEKQLNFTIDDKSTLTNINTLEDLIRIIEENSHEF